MTSDSSSRPPVSRCSPQSSSATATASTSTNTAAPAPAAGAPCATAAKATPTAPPGGASAASSRKRAGPAGLELVAGGGPEGHRGRLVGFGDRVEAAGAEGVEAVLACADEGGG